MITVSPTFGLVLPHMTDAGAAELAKGAAELAKGASELANVGVAALNTSVAKGCVVVAKGCVVVALIAVTVWGVKSILHELRDTTVKHDVNHRGTLPPPPSTT
jgi:X-X-X-Leu-X-X-Gly heptad repeat protein